MAISVRTFVSTDKATVSMEIWDGETALAHAVLHPSELSSLIQQLGDARSVLSELVAPELDPGSRIATVIDPVWRIEATPPGYSGAALNLRHPGFGWLGFLFPPNDAAKLATWLGSTAGK